MVKRLRDAFPMADLFINIDDEEEAERLLDRFIKALFGSNKISPTPDEFGMYIAKSAALRSLDLSRQVGAAIFSSNDEIISLGCNEVPRAGGGNYWCTDPEEARDYTRDHDENEKMKRSILADLIRRLTKSELIRIDVDADELVATVLEASELKRSPIRESQLMDLLEFGRPIHAEMSAISDAARIGLALRGATMYCTTFPCHICAKHIVAAGIVKIKYIEPFPKSYAEQLHSDSIHVGTKGRNDNKVLFSPFIGISPTRFYDLFEKRRRKDQTGKFEEWVNGSPHPNVSYTVATYLSNEAAYTKMFEELANARVSSGEISVDGREIETSDSTQDE